MLDINKQYDHYIKITEIKDLKGETFKESLNCRGIDYIVL